MFLTAGQLASATAPSWLAGSFPVSKDVCSLQVVSADDFLIYQCFLSSGLALSYPKRLPASFSTPWSWAVGLKYASVNLPFI